MQKNRARYSHGHVVEDFMDDDREAIAAHRAVTNSLVDPCLPFGFLAADNDGAQYPYLPSGILAMREARNLREWVRADEIRAQLAKQGWQVRTLANGSVEWQRDYRVI